MGFGIDLPHYRRAPHALFEPGNRLFRSLLGYSARGRRDPANSSAPPAPTLGWNSRPPAIAILDAPLAQKPPPRRRRTCSPDRCRSESVGIGIDRSPL